MASERANRPSNDPPCASDRAGRLPAWVALGLAAGTLALPSGVWGQDDWDAQPARPPAAADGMAVVRIPDIDQWVLGGTLAGQTREALESQLGLHVQSVDRACGLSADQRRKLELAGHGDVKTVLAGVDELKKKYQGAQFNPNDQKFHQVIQEIQPLRLRVEGGLFGEGSIYQKVLKRTLNPEQSARYQEEERKRRRFQYEAKIALTLARMESMVPLDDDQRQKLTRLLLEETEPPKKFGQYDHYAVLHQMGTLNEARLRPILHDSQWKAMQRALSQGRQMGSFLRQNGWIP